MNKKIVAVGVTALLLALPLAAMAFAPGNVPNQVANLNINDLIDILFKILWIVFVAFAIVMFLLAGIQFFTAQGDASKVADARNFVLWGVVGMVVALLAFSLPFIVRNTLGNGV